MQGHVDKIESEKKARPSYPGDAEVRNALSILRARGMDDGAIAAAFNAKKIPTRHYDPKKARGNASWTVSDIEAFSRQGS